MKQVRREARGGLLHLKALRTSVRRAERRLTCCVSVPSGHEHMLQLWPDVAGAGLSDADAAQSLWSSLDDTSLRRSAVRESSRPGTACLAPREEDVPEEEDVMAFSGRPPPTTSFSLAVDPPFRVFDFEIRILTCGLDTFARTWHTTTVALQHHGGSAPHVAGSGSSFRSNAQKIRTTASNTPRS